MQVKPGQGKGVEIVTGRIYLTFLKMSLCHLLGKKKKKARIYECVVLCAGAVALGLLKD